MITQSADKDMEQLELSLFASFHKTRVENYFAVSIKAGHVFCYDPEIPLLGEKEYLCTNMYKRVQSNFIHIIQKVDKFQCPSE